MKIANVEIKRVSVIESLLQQAHVMKKLTTLGLALSLLVVAMVNPAQAQLSDNAILVFKTDQVGMHRISYQELLATADLKDLKHNKFALVSDGQAVPIRTKGQNRTEGRPGRFGPGGFIEFYAEAPLDLYNTERAFVLVYDRSQRVAIKSENAVPNDALPSASEYTHSETFDESIYYDYLSPSKTDPWHYGQIISFFPNPGTDVPFTLDGLVGNSAELIVNVYGIVDIKSDVNDHHVSVSMNGVEVGDEQFDGNVSHTFSVPNVPVTSGDNNFRLGLKPIAESPYDAVGLNTLTVRYQRNAIMTGDQLEGSFAQGQAEVATLNGPAAVYRKETNGGLVRLRRAKNKNGLVRFATATEADYVVVSNYLTPVVAGLPELVDITSGEAEYLILTHANFLGGALDSLVQLRAADYSVKVVDVSQVYAQFGNTLPGASAIAAYVQFAAANMGTRFVTLVGSDTYDYKNFGNSNSVSFIPTQYAETPGGFLFVRQTPSDASYGDLDGDNVPDIPVGRLSVRTPTELGVVIEKIQDYQAREGYAGRILIAADEKDVGNGISFTDDVDAMIDAIPLPDWQGSIRADFKAIPDIDGGVLAHDKVINAINAGVSVAAYIGHSSQQQWSRTTPPLFQASEIAGLTNLDKPTLITQWGCWNTYFVDPNGNSMADQFLVGSEAGAATVLGASTLTTSDGERALGIELSKLMYLEGKPIGEAIVEAKQAIAADNPDATDILLGWQILGDPALVVNP